MRTVALEDESARGTRRLSNGGRLRITGTDLDLAAHGERLAGFVHGREARSTAGAVQRVVEVLVERDHRTVAIDAPVGERCRVVEVDRPVVVQLVEASQTCGC